MPLPYPERIVCMTEESTEWLYLLGQEHRIAGISGFTVRPPRARKEKPKVAAFTSAKIDRIMELDPDLVLGFSDLQADIAAELIRRGVNVHIYNQRSVDEIFSMLLTLGAAVGCQSESEHWIREIEEKIKAMKQESASRARKPKVFFEEWFDPVISGIQWVSELIEIAGGEDCFPELAKESLGKNRIIADHRDVASRNPDIFLGSWCGRKFRPEHVYEREGWDQVNCVKNRQVFEIKSANILQPGPAALTDGLDQVKDIIDNWYHTVSSAQSV